MYFHRPPFWMRWLAPRAIWRMDPGQKVIYLTFDDGPTPGITDRLIDLLAKHGVCATFFCLGKQAQLHPDLMVKLREQGHRIGHHSFSHLNGWKTDDRPYTEDVDYAAGIIGGDLFRPPYGKIRVSQYRNLSSKYRVIMWSLMPGDFDQGITAAQCLSTSLEKSRNGDILVYHDNEKCGMKMLQVVEDFISEMKRRGFSFAVIPN
jgi:peptidoglycan-N-acetylglucosamine deacetylase